MKEELKKQTIAAMKSGDTLRVSTLRLLSNAIHNEEIAKQRELTPEEEVAIIRRQLKQRDEAILALRQAQGKLTSSSPADLVMRIEREEQEAVILREFLPEEMSEENLGKIVEEVIAEAETPDFGRVMGAVMAKVGGRVDGGVVARMVQLKLKN
jgi:uncharacterized protein YqeY